MDQRIDDEADDAILAMQARRERHAFAPLYRRYVLPIHRYCYRRLGSREAAEDATSMIFTKTLSSLPTFHNETGTFRTWLFTIAHNAITDNLRARRPAVPLDDARDLVDGAPSPEELALRAEADRSVADLLARLPPAQRRVMELRLAGLTGPEIAHVLGRSRNAVNVAQFRAIARLRRLVGVTPTCEEARRDP